jgi:hypothetical protein
MQYQDKKKSNLIKLDFFDVYYELKTTFHHPQFLDVPYIQGLKQNL